jgi:PPM family protein phosphatase
VSQSSAAPRGEPGGEIVVNVFARTDVGRTREHNEDTFLVADLTAMRTTLQEDVRTHTPGNRGSLFMVADGMGGAAAGEIASAMATDTVLRELETRWSQSPNDDSETFARALKAAAESANARIHRYAAEHPENRGMGTTATIAGFLGDTLYLVQVGDSRAYLVRDGVARQLTKDQSLMQKLVEAGEMTAEEAEVSERRNIILQALGPEPMVKVDLTYQQVRRGDTLVLCSDGLSGQMRGEDIARIVSGTQDLAVACKRMIDLANENGGPDNITVVAVRFEGSGLSVAASGEGVGHQVYTSESEQRVTQPVDVGAIPVAALEELPTEPREAGRRKTEDGSWKPEDGGPKAEGGRPRATPDTPYEAPSIEPMDRGPLAATPEAGGQKTGGGGRISEQTLRLIFTVIGVLVAAVILYNWWRGK